MMKQMAMLGAVCLAWGIFLPGRSLAADGARDLQETAAAAHTIASPAAQKAAALPAESTAADNRTVSNPLVTPSMQKVRLDWPLVPNAVRYQLVIMKDKSDQLSNVLKTNNYIFTNGYELDTSSLSKLAKQDCYWKVRGLDYDGHPIGGFTQPVPITSGVLNTDAPEPTTQFDQMAYAPLYPVYSWIPYLGSSSYEINIYRKSSISGRGTLVRTLWSQGSNYYDDAGYTQPGTYWWQVRALSSTGAVLSNWSVPKEFKVTTPVRVAALGDSITHGGGAVSTPPGYLMYDWESYSTVPIKNLGYSGNTVEDMNERFERDVLPFAPKILVIMGGVNNFRAGGSGWSIIHTLAVIRDKCYANGIIPVFATATPINPWYIEKTKLVEQPTDDWIDQQQTLNHWIMTQKYAVDVTPGLTDGNGFLRDGYTTDGLHPDMEGKKYIGETISRYLQAKFPQIITGK